MTNKYEAPFDGGTTPDPTRKGKIKNRARKLARKAMKKAATPVSEGRMKETLPDDDAGEYEHYMQTKDPKSGLTGQQIQQRKAMDVADFKKRREEMNAKRQAGTKPLSTTYKEKVELDEEFINGREYASHGLMHPKHAMQGIHQPSGQVHAYDKNGKLVGNYRSTTEAKKFKPGHKYKTVKETRDVDFYASGTGDKMLGKVEYNDGKTVHIQAHQELGDGKLHKFKVTTDLPKMTNEEAELMIELSPDTLRGAANVAGSKFKMSDINPRGAHRNPKKLMKAYDRFAFLNSRAIDAGHSEKNAERNDTSYSDEYVKEIKRRKAHTANMKKIFAQRKADSAAKKAAKMKKEEFEIYEAKDEGEYDYEGDMAMSQLKSVIANAQKLHDMLEPNTNLPEWVQSKITLAEDYIVTAANYMDGEMNEEVEQIEERAKGYEKLPSARKARADRGELAVEAHDPVGKEDADINNDGKTDKTDVYLHTRRRAIGKAISNRLAAKAGK
jgi:hypothetical protein